MQDVHCQVLVMGGGAAAMRAAIAAHLEEFPEKDDTHWLCNLLIHQGSGGVLQVRKAPVATV